MDYTLPILRDTSINTLACVKAEIWHHAHEYILYIVQNHTGITIFKHCIYE